MYGYGYGYGRVTLQRATPLLDRFPGAAAAYSLRKLRTDYTGAAIRVRESATNTETDIGFNADGSLNTTALIAHTGANDGFVVTWYDQSGNSNDATQATAANQPKIYDSITGVILSNNKPALKFDGIDDAFVFTSTGGNTRTVLIAIDTDLNTTLRKRVISEARFISLADNSGYNFETRGDQANDPLVLTLYNNTPNSIAQNNPTIGNALLTIKITSTQNAIYRNTTEVATGNFNMDGNYSIGGISSINFPIDALYSEIIIYNTDQSSNRTAIESNINAYYNIY